jgi:hypothetical protein
MQRSAPFVCAGSPRSAPIIPTALCAVASARSLGTQIEFDPRHSEEEFPSGNYSGAAVWRGPAWWKSRTAAAPRTRVRSNGCFARSGCPVRTRSAFSRGREHPIAGNRLLVELPPSAGGLSPLFIATEPNATYRTLPITQPVFLFSFYCFFFRNSGRKVRA